MNYADPDKHTTPGKELQSIIGKMGRTPMRAKKSKCSLATLSAMLAILFHLSSLRAQAQSESEPSFNTASVIPENGGCRNRISQPCPDGTTHVTVPSPFQPGGRYQTCGNLENFVRDAFNTGNRLKVFGLPEWGSRDLYEIDAKGDDGIGVEQIRLMLRDLLEKRFRLKFHYETRMIDVYTLLVAEGGHKLQPAMDDSGAPLNELPIISVEPCSDNLRAGAMQSISNDSSGLSVLGAKAVDLNKFAGFMVNATGCTVVDRTEIEGLFDIKLRYGPYRGYLPSSISCPPSQDLPSTKPSSPSIFSALKELGLELKLAKVPLELLIIDDARKPECTDSSGVIPCP